MRIAGVESEGLDAVRSLPSPGEEDFPKSLYYRTELFFLRPEGRLTAHSWGLCVESPGNPTHYYGNFLLLKEPPLSEERDLWIETFRACFAHAPEVEHVTFLWDAQSASTAAFGGFTDAGFDVEEAVALRATFDELGVPAPTSVPVTFRALSTDSDWAAATRLQVLARDEEYEEGKYRVYKTRQMERYRRLADAGKGAWFGAFRDDELVADLGLFGGGDLFRYQMVETHPDHRRLGICRALVREAARALVPPERRGTAALVIAADANYHSLALYEGLGFRPFERHVSLCLPPP